jgi:DNA polymerase III alpha subunit
LKDPQELRKIWRGLPEAVWNAEYIAENCSVDLEFKKYKFPSFPLPYSETPFSHLWKVAFRGLEERYRPITDQAVKRLQHELEVIEELGFCDYFLIVWDIVREAKKRGMMTLGRGSAANSLVSYCLGFTDIDPLEQNLYFERFLNRGRLSPPDVDLDFSWKERDEIVKYVYEKYGYDRVAMISTMVTFRARSAFRETAKVFGIANSEISKYSKFIPWTSAHNLPELAKKFPEARSLKFEDEPWKSIIKIATKLAGFPRHLSIHPGGIVITEEPMTNYVPLEYAKNKGLGLIVTQPDMYPIEDMGLIKIDLLSQRSLGVLRDTLGRLKQDEGKAPKGKPNIFDIRDKS